ncbi:MAG: hypothetical protein M3464_17775 [Chloroflexota bacterium]|nr:hypothetical protein [Chloroflexota bacterium]
MSRGTQVDWGVFGAVTLLVMQGAAKAQIYKQLGTDGLIDSGGSPSKSTIDRIVDDTRARDTTGPWSLTEATDPQEPALVLDVILHMNAVSQGRVWLSKDQARLVARVRRTAPEIPPQWAYVMASMYQQARDRDGDLRTLDLVMAVAPWRRTGAPGAWGIYTPQPVASGRNATQPPDIHALIKFLSQLAIGFTVGQPELPDD